MSEAVSAPQPQRGPVTLIQADRPWWRINIREVWEYRDLMMLLVKRDLTAVYKQTVLGPLWFVLQPLLTTVVFTIIFGGVAKIDVGEVPHFLFIMTGMVFWNYLQGVMNHGANALAGSASLLTKVYFPRLVIPLSGVVAHLAHFAINFSVLIGFFLWFWFSGAAIQPNRWLLVLPVLLLQCAMMGLGVGLWVSSITIKYRDLRFALPFLTQLWMYASPIVYPASLVVNPVFRFILWLNPFTAVVEFSRYAFTGAGSPDLGGWALSWSVTLILLASGLLNFCRVERNFVDLI
jgi:lipopolysaccharide transport system permease protein